MFTVLIPARFGSTRFPGKPLCDIAGKPMVVRVAEQARESGADAVWVATDDQRIVDAVVDHGFDALLTRSDHATGTDRLAEAAIRLRLPDDAIIVNTQGDEPLLDPTLIAAVADELSTHADAAVATACHPIEQVAEAFSANVVKVVLDRAGYALYFSRAAIPWARDAYAAAPNPNAIPTIPPDLPLFRHYGLYAYRVAFLRVFPTLAPTPLERFEALEQLRALWHGYKIAVKITDSAPAPGVDTEEDLVRVRALYASGK